MRFLPGAMWRFGRQLARDVAAFGPWTGTRLALRELGRPRLLRVAPSWAPAMWARVGRGQSDLEALKPIWRDGCYVIDDLPAPHWVIDAGANVGYATRWLAERYPDATVVAIEPDAGNVDVLRRNVAGLANVEVLHAALGAEDGEAQLVDAGSGPWSFRVGPARPGDAGRVIATVPVVSMATVIDRFAIDRIGLLKVDIEGGEVEVFRTSAPWIGIVDAVVAELHDRFRPGCMRAFIEATTGFAQEYARDDNTFAVRA